MIKVRKLKNQAQTPLWREKNIIKRENLENRNQRKQTNGQVNLK